MNWYQTMQLKQIVCLNWGILLTRARESLGVSTNRFLVDSDTILERHNAQS